MHTEKKSVGLLAGLVLLAVCAIGSTTVRAAENPNRPGDVTSASAKQSSVNKRSHSKAQNLKAANAKQKKRLTDAKAKTNKQSPDGSASEIKQLKKQLALQQKQIEELLHAVNQLRAAIAASPKVSATAPVKQAANNAPSSTVASPVGAVAPAMQPSGANEVASLTPILPPEPKTRSRDANQVVAVNTPVNLPSQNNSRLGGLKNEGTTHPAVTGSESSPAGQKKKSGPLDLDNGKIKIGTTFYGLYRYYANTGFGPQTLTQINRPGPGNGGFNSFDVNRTYLNFFYSPNDALTFRVTPNLYRQYGGASGEKLGSVAATGSDINGNLVLRIKYAYVDFNKLFAHSKAFSKDKLTFGQQQNPLVDWEEGLYGYRFVNLTPWNYLSLSSTYPGIRLHGPIMLHGKQYLDYEVGVFNNQSFHAYETGDKKQVMARLSYYPFGAVSKYQGLGLTGFVDYGHKDAAPDQNINVPMTRVAALVHYTTKSNDYGIAGEFDYGRNAFSEHNLFSGSGPADAFGLGPTQYAPFNSLTAALLGGTHTRQRGFDFFGHARLGKSPFYLFGMFEQFNPNYNVSKNPLEFRTVVGGISYKYSKNWEFALDSQNIIYTHGQFTFPASQLALYSPSLAASNPNGIPNAVPTSTNAIFFNVLFNY